MITEMIAANERVLERCIGSIGRECLQAGITSLTFLFCPSQYYIILLKVEPNFFFFMKLEKGQTYFGGGHLL